MEINEYKNIFENEDFHWWYKSLHGCILNHISEMPFDGRLRPHILDVGCGTGGLLSKVHNHYPLWNLTGVDVSEDALQYCGKRNLVQLHKASIEALPFNDALFDLVISVDVIYHKDVLSDSRALAELYRVLKVGGVLLLHVPAFEFLKNQHDQVVSTARRYDKKQLIQRVQDSGFHVHFCSYRYLILFPVLLLKKLIQKWLGPQKPSSSLDISLPWINHFLYTLVTFENKLMRFMNIPFGSSLFCVATK